MDAPRSLTTPFARFVLAGILIAAFIAASTAATLGLTERSFQRQLLDQNAERAHAASLAVSRVLNDNLGSVRGFARRAGVVSAATKKDWAKMHTNLVALVASNPTFAAASFYDAKARLRARSPSDKKYIGFAFSKQDYFKGARKPAGGHISAMYKQQSAPKTSVVAFSVKVVNAKKALLGVLVATAPAAKLDTRFTATAPVSGSLQIFNHIGQRISPAKSATLASFSGNPIVQAAMDGGSDSRVGTVRGTAGERLIAYEPAKSGWAVVLERPFKKETARLNTLKQRTTLLGVALALLSFITVVGAYVGARRTRPEL